MRAHRILHEAALTTSLTVSILAACMAACTGDIGGPDDGNANNASGGSSGGPNLAAECTTVSPGAAPIRRLTQSQYNNTVRDLLGDTTNPADSFPPDQTTGVFSNNAASQTVSPLLAQSYQQTAEALAATAIGNK